MTTPVRIVVRAGAELGDLEATLNGVQVGEDFARDTAHGLRVLDASSSHGLRHGENVLEVTARTGWHVEKQTVHFVVAHRMPLTGAGRDRRVAVGATVRLDGLVVRHASDASVPKVRWSVVSSPLAPLLPANELRSLSPSFTPKAPGRYELELQANSAAGTTSDRVTIDAVAPSPQVVVDTAVDGPDPPGATSDGKPFDANDRPGIRVGDTVYRAPWMRNSGAGGSYSGQGPGGVPYHALWQILALDRSTLQVIWNRTYGLCSAGQEAFFCRQFKGSPDPKIVDVQAELDALRNSTDAGASAIIIASSHPTVASPTGRQWGPPNELDFAVDKLGPNGLPGGSEARDHEFAAELSAAAPGSITLIGIAGMSADPSPTDPEALTPEGDVSLVEPGGVLHGRGRMEGYFTFDTTNEHYVFTRSARPQFDTRTPTTPCTQAEATCRVAQTVNGQTAIGTMPNGGGGYLVTAYDPHSLARLAAATFVTDGSGNDDANAQAMAKFLEDRGGEGDLVAITTLETPKQVPAITAGKLVAERTWLRLACLVAQLGGSRDRFNTAAVTPDTDYSLLGWKRSRGGFVTDSCVGGSDFEGEAEGVQSTNAQGRLRGALVQDNRSLFRPANTSSDSGGDGPPDRLQQVVAQAPAPGGGWPELPGGPQDSQGKRNAIACVGSVVGALGSNPRAAYWTNPVGVLGSDVIYAVQTTAATGTDECRKPFTDTDLTWARGELVQELLWVGRVRKYMADLYAPMAPDADQASWHAKALADELFDQLKYAKEQSQIALEIADAVTAGLAFIPGLAEAFEFKNFAKAAEAILATSETITYSLNAAWAGGGETEVVLEADNLADELFKESQRTQSGFNRIGDIIVGDYAKLKEVGRSAECALPCAGFNPEYALGDAGVERTLFLRADDRLVYEHLVPLGFQPWDTGLATVPDPSKNHGCSDGVLPFGEAPANGWGGDAPGPPAHFGASAQSLDELDPGQHAFDPNSITAPHSRWRTYLLAHRDGQPYYWPSQNMLDRMFGPVSPEWDPADETDGGLGISPQDFMRSAQPRFESDLCYWVVPNSFLTYEPDPGAVG